jgi:Family of unknown function (DUF695)
MFGRKRTEAVEDMWNVFQGTYDGRPLLVRGNIGAKKLVGSKAYPIKVGLAVPFRNPRPDGFPEPAEDAELGVVEETIIARIAGHAVLVAVLTTNGMREFVAYTGDGSWLPEFDRGLQTAVTTHEVQIDARTDPDWSAYRQLVK